MTDSRKKVKQQAFALTICTVVFLLVYNLAMHHAVSLAAVPSITFDFEKSIPFIPLSIIPYMASGFFFCLVFFSCQSVHQLKILTYRMLFVTVIAGACFVLFPLKFAYEKPDVSGSILSWLFVLLKTVDSPFNQSPSLHIAFAYVFWSVFKDLSKWKTFLMITMILIGISTLTTYQHHLLDIATGSVLAHLSFIIIPYRKNEMPFRNLWLANFYFLSGWILMLATLFIANHFGNSGLILLIPAFIIFVLGYCCQKNYRLITRFLPEERRILEPKKN